MGTAKRFHVALSFPGERRAYVAEVAGHLAKALARERVLYDAWYEAEFARTDLDTYLQGLYQDESDLIAVFLCSDYERKDWCRLEWRAVKDLIKRRQGAAVMPLRFDLTEIPGLFSTDGYVWVGDGRDPAEVAELVLQRWRHNGGVLVPDPAPLPPGIDLNHLPAGTEHFLGREAELSELDAAWSNPGGTAVVECIAPGGTGKTTLIKRWLDNQRAAAWTVAAHAAERVYGWSFYSQGTGDNRQASEDHFLAAALDWFGVAIDPATHPADKGRALALAVAERRTLLILDGVEPLQYPPGSLAGELRAPGIKALLTHLAAADQPGLCVLTSREWLQDLAEWVRRPDHLDGPVVRLDLGNLSDHDGARLLHRLGADRAGAAPIAPDDPELTAVAREVRGHALTLSLLGNYLRLAHGGDIRCRDRVDLRDADAETNNGHAFRVMAAYETWFAAAGEAGARELAALRLFGFFDRPAAPEDLAALRAAPPIPGLTEALFTGSAGVPPASARSSVRVLGFARKVWRSIRHREPPDGGLPAGSRRSPPDPAGEPLGDTQWRIALKRLEDAGLIAPPGPDGGLDAHPLVREYLAAALADTRPAAWQEGHRRVYERLKGSVPHRPEGLAGLQPLYQAVAHGCLGGLWQEVCDQVYIDRILGGTGNDGFYSTRKLGAFGADLGAIACLFGEPWSRPAPALKEGHQAWLLNATAFRLRALGRLGEALEPMRAAVEVVVKREDWKHAAVGYGNLSELQLTLGRIPAAVADAERCVDYADRSGDAFQRMSKPTILADALHQRGETAEARERFAEAEAMQAERQPQYPLLYSLPGFRYCDLLLAGAERAAWTATGGALPAGSAGACEEVARRAGQTLSIAERNNWLLDVALDHLTLARCALYADRLAGRPPGPEAEAQTERALDGLRAAGRQDYLPRGLLTRAWLRHAQGDPVGAEADLAEAERIASRGGMQLHLADCAVYRARLFHDRAALAQARDLIEAHGYGRRLPELEDAKAAAESW